MEILGDGILKVNYVILMTKMILGKVAYNGLGGTVGPLTGSKT